MPCSDVEEPLSNYQHVENHREKFPTETNKLEPHYSNSVKKNNVVSNNSNPSDSSFLIQNALKDSQPKSPISEISSYGEDSRDEYIPATDDYTTSSESGSTPKLFLYTLRGSKLFIKNLLTYSN